MLQAAPAHVAKAAALADRLLLLLVERCLLLLLLLRAREEALIAELHTRKAATLRIAAKDADSSRRRVAARR